MKIPRLVRSCPCLLAVFACLSAPAVRGEIAITANDNKWVTIDGVGQAPATVVPDTISIIEISATPPRIIAEIEVPVSVSGPPLSVAVSPDESLALVTASMSLDPATRQLMPDNRVSVVDLKSSPPRVIDTITVGSAPGGVSIRPDGKMALVANRNDGTVSILRIDGRKVTVTGSLAIAGADASVSHAVFTPDGRRALLTRYGDHTLTLLDIEGDTAKVAGRDMFAGLRPYAADIGGSGRIAVVGNVGMGAGDNDTISVIDLEATPPRVVGTVTVPQTPEGIKLSRDGTLCAVVTMNGSNKATASPFYGDHGLLVLFRVDGTSLTRLADAPIGHWSQGVAISADNSTILVTNMDERDVQVFSWDGRALRDTGTRLKVGGGPAAIRTAGS